MSTATKPTQWSGPVLPCDKCGDPAGKERTGCKRPARARGDRWGFVGSVCLTCYWRLDGVKAKHDARRRTRTKRRHDADPAFDARCRIEASHDAVPRSPMAPEMAQAALDALDLAKIVAVTPVEQTECDRVTAEAAAIALATRTPKARPVLQTHEVLPGTRWDELEPEVFSAVLRRRVRRGRTLCLFSETVGGHAAN